MKKNWFLLSLKFALGFVLFFTVLAWVIMELWNMVIPEITGWSVISYYQAVLLLILSRLLAGFKCFRGNFFKHKWKHKYASMSEEEREELREKFKKRWCQ